MILFLKHVLIDSILYVLLLIVSTRHVDKYIAWYLLYVKFPKTEKNVFLIYVDLFTNWNLTKHSLCTRACLALCTHTQQLNNVHLVCKWENKDMLQSTKRQIDINKKNNNC